MENSFSLGEKIVTKKPVSLAKNIGNVRKEISLVLVYYNNSKVHYIETLHKLILAYITHYWQIKCDASRQ